MIQEPKWSLILDYLYSGEIKQIQGREDLHDDTVATRDDIREELELNYSEIDNSLEYMDAAGLISETKRHSENYVLTPRGFQVAHDREKMKTQQENENKRLKRQEKRQDHRAKNQNEINSAIGYLTVGLVFVTFSHTLVYSLFQVDAPIFSIGISIFVASIVFLYLIYKLSITGLLDPISKGNRNQEHDSQSDL